MRAEIARSHESSGVPAKGYGVSTETIRKWRKRGLDSCQGRSARPHKLPWRASDEERVQRGNQDETSASIKVRGTADLMTQGGRSPTGGVRSASA